MAEAVGAGESSLSHPHNRWATIDNGHCDNFNTAHCGAFLNLDTDLRLHSAQWSHSISVHNHSDGPRPRFRSASHVYQGEDCCYPRQHPSSPTPLHAVQVHGSRTRSSDGEGVAPAEWCNALPRLHVRPAAVDHEETSRTLKQLWAACLDAEVVVTQTRMSDERYTVEHTRELAPDSSDCAAQKPRASIALRNVSNDCSEPCGRRTTKSFGRDDIELVQPIQSTTMADLSTCINIKRQFYPDPLLSSSNADGGVSLWLGEWTGNTKNSEIRKYGGDAREAVVLKIAPHQGMSSKAEIRAMGVVREVTLLSRIEPHKNIVRLKSPVAYRTEHSVVSLLELLQGPDLYDLIASKGRQTEANTRNIIKNILEGLNHLHRLGIVHSDIKPENIVLRDPNDFSSVCLIDFETCTTFNTRPPPTSEARGFSESSNIASVPLNREYVDWNDALPGTGSDETQNIDFGATIIPTFTGGNGPLAPIGTAGIVRGTLGYVAPECLNQVKMAENRASENQPSMATPDKCDIYSLGIVAFMLLTGYHPFCVLEEGSHSSTSYTNMLKLNKNGRVDEILAKAMNGDDSANGFLNISAGAADLVTKMCEVNAPLRLTTQEALQHSWITQSEES